jgi:hypothetical protein
VGGHSTGASLKTPTRRVSRSGSTCDGPGYCPTTRVLSGCHVLDNRRQIIQNLGALACFADPTAERLEGIVGHVLRLVEPDGPVTILGPWDGERRLWHCSSPGYFVEVP